MVDTTDVQGYRTKYENQLALLEKADIHEDDRDTIERFVVHLRANDTDVDSLGAVVGHQQYRALPRSACSDRG